MLPSSHIFVGVHFEAVFVRRQARQYLNGRRCSGRHCLRMVRQSKHVIVRCLARVFFFFGFLPISRPAAQFAGTCQRHHQSSLLEALRYPYYTMVGMRAPWLLQITATSLNRALRILMYCRSTEKINAYPLRVLVPTCMCIYLVSPTAPACP